MAATGRQRAKFNYSAVTLPDSARVYVPYDEHFRTAWTALYLANPTSIKAFHYYAMTLLSSDPVLMTCYENIPPALGRTKLRTPHMEQFEKMRTGRDKMAQIIAVNYLKLDELCAFIKRQFQRFETAETNYGKLLGGWVGHVTYQNILKNHRSYKENVQRNGCRLPEKLSRATHATRCRNRYIFFCRQRYQKYCSCQAESTRHKEDRDPQTPLRSCCVQTHFCPRAIATPSKIVIFVLLTTKNVKQELSFCNLRFAI